MNIKFTHSLRRGQWFPEREVPEMSKWKVSDFESVVCIHSDCNYSIFIGYSDNEKSITVLKGHYSN